MRLCKTFNISMYNCQVYFGIVESVKNTVNKLYVKNNESQKLTEEPGGVFVYFNIHKYYIFINKDNIYHSTIAHEVFHLVEQLSKDRDISDEESKCYLCGNITENIYNFLKLKNLQVA